MVELVLHVFAFIGVISIGGAAVAAILIYRDKRAEERELAEFPYNLEFEDDPAEFDKVYETSDDNIVWGTGNDTQKKESV